MEKKIKKNILKSLNGKNSISGISKRKFLFRSLWKKLRSINFDIHGNDQNVNIAKQSLKLNSYLKV
jgi:hypothetical protein